VLLVDDVRLVDSHELKAICPRYEEVQWYTDLAYERVSSTRSGLSPTQFGTAVHKDLSDQVRDLKDLFFRSEVSFIKSTGIDADYGEKGSLRIDVLEKVKNDTVCVYDIKTGKTLLYPGRSAEIATTVYNRFGPVNKVIVTEIRASQEKRK
jgi:hypothetical protein